ncbi:MAG: SEC-C metal-binding domain-containing protein [Bacillota bacterium]
MLTASFSLSCSIGRNDSCLCGSGNKYKKCCINKSEDERREAFEDPDRPLVNEWLFHYNPIIEISAAMLMYTTFSTPQLREIATKLTKTIITRGEEEAEQIRTEQDPMRLLDKLRKGTDNLNYDLLIKRLLEYEGQVTPPLLNKLGETEDEVLIELGAQYLFQCTEFPLHQIKEMAVKSRNPYVRSALCLLLGFKGPESVLPIIWRQFHSLRKHYPSESYMQAPLLGLYEYGYRFGLLKQKQ